PFSSAPSSALPASLPPSPLHYPTPSSLPHPSPAALSPQEPFQPRAGPTLNFIVLRHNFLSGPFPPSLPHPTLPSLPPSLLPSLPLSHCSKFFRNYLTGTFPAPGPALKNIDLQHNFLFGSFPSHSATYCTATSNCFSQASNCNTAATTQRTPAACSICNVTMAADAAGAGWVVPAAGSSQVLCGGGSCAPNASAPFSNRTPYTSSSPLLPMFCALIGMASGSSQAMLALKSSLGVTLSSWASVPTATVMGVVSTSASFPTTSSPSLAYLCPVAGALAAPMPASAAASAWKGVELLSFSHSLVYLCPVAAALVAPMPASSAASAWKGVECNAAGAVVKM
ncbi:unnamed protein product, partial [Closterium sp. NIES-54]